MISSSRNEADQLDHIHIHTDTRKN